MAINRTKFSTLIPAQEQSRISKAIVVNTTMRGYLHIVSVRTQIVNDQEIEVFQDVLVHPDRAASIDVTKFDALSFQGLTPRNAPGEPRPNTTYHWAQGVKAVGKHLVEYLTDENSGERQTFLAGVGIYMTEAELREAEAEASDKAMAGF